MQRLPIHDTCITFNFSWQIKVGAHARVCKRRILWTIQKKKKHSLILFAMNYFAKTVALLKYGVKNFAETVVDSRHVDMNILSRICFGHIFTFNNKWHVHLFTCVAVSVEQWNTNVLVFFILFGADGFGFVFVFFSLYVRLLVVLCRFFADKMMFFI